MNEEQTKAAMGFATQAIHRGEEPCFDKGASGDVAAPIHLSTTFARREVSELTGGYEYARTLNPTRFALESKLACLEQADYGLAFSSGLAAETSVILACLKSGDHVIAFDDLYGGTKRIINEVFTKYGISVTYTDATNPENIQNALRQETRMIWVESPTNPLQKLCDIRAIASIAKKADALLLIDNTFMSPYFQHPLVLGADIVLHSATKYIGGHSDVIGGVVMLNRKDLYDKIKYIQNACGAILAPFDSYLLMRGIKTLELRMQRHYENALKIATYLESSPKVTRVLYPGLPSHPQYELNRSQAEGCGGVVTFYLNAPLAGARRFLSSLKIFSLAESLGGVESLIEHPALMTHASVPVAEREKIGISDSLIRASVGIESCYDLIADLKQALDAI